ncbi:hypothetical protein L1887_33159 [Cichorium endivia]|nr:hypothetical protein L1887_33159 [Cichorium endivia]
MDDTMGYDNWPSADWLNHRITFIRAMLCKCDIDSKMFEFLLFPKIKSRNSLQCGVRFFLSDHVTRVNFGSGSWFPIFS